MKSEEDRPDARRPLLLSVAITVGAIGVAAAHLRWPSLKIDQVTLVLLAIAIIPWLSPLFRSIELPGGMKVEFQELKRELKEKSEKVDDLENRVDRVEAFVLKGDVTPELRETLVSSLQRFHDYLETLNLPVAIPKPSVYVDESDTADASYDGSKGQLRISKLIAKDSQVVYHEYSHHVLGLMIAESDTQVPGRVLAIEAGLSDYYACSFTDNPILGQQIAALIPRYRNQGYVRSLLNNKKFTAVEDYENPHMLGEVWGGVFWDVRKLLGKDADQILMAAWIAAKGSSNDFERDFVRSILNLVRDSAGDESASTAQGFFEDRGMTL